MENFYDEAYRKGQKYIKAKKANGEDPYLPVLDEILDGKKQGNGIDVGMMNVPAELLVGTKTRGRSYDFAGNFMPIADEMTEFGTKWKNLCNSHLEEGIRDAVLVYEYMNRYYVQEGNKRVSVLKFFDAVTIPAIVKRILPEKTDDPAVIAYYEYLEFYKVTKINFLDFTKPGSYQEFLTLVGKEKTEGWDEDEVKMLKSCYYRFSKEFKAAGGSRLTITKADAFLAFLQIYKLKEIREMYATDLRKKITGVWQEMKLQEEETPIEVQMDPDDGNVGMLTKLMTKKAKRVCFLYSAAPDTSEWIQGHEMGRLRLEEVMGDKITTFYEICKGEEETIETLKLAIADGADVIFATSGEMAGACLKVAVDHPEVLILSCSINKPHRYIRSYYPRMYEAKFVSGAIAGAMCTNDKIGYICRYPIYGSIAEINAFARGVQMTRPSAGIYLEWADDHGNAVAADRLIAEGVQLISVRDNLRNEDGRRPMFGLNKVEEGNLIPLAYPALNWGEYYEKMMKAIQSGSFKNDSEKTTKSLSYFWGMSSEVVEVFFSGKIPKGVRYLGELLCEGIKNKTLYPFYNPAERLDGRIEWGTKDQSISIEDIIKMEWLEGNIVGKIPSYEELDEKAKKLVDVMGIPCAKKDYVAPEGNEEA